jgi:hypothetical protein
MNLARAFQEFRREHRFPISKEGRVYFTDGRAPVDCVIRNLNSRGAKIEFEGPYSGPDFLTLQIGIGELVQTRAPCTIRWTKGNEIGVEFDRRQSFILHS